MGQLISEPPRELSDKMHLNMPYYVNTGTPWYKPGSNDRKAELEPILDILEPPR